MVKELVTLLAGEIRKKLLGLVLQPADNESNVSLFLMQIGGGGRNANAVKSRFRLEISIFKILSISTLEASRKLVIKKLVELYHTITIVNN